MSGYSGGGRTMIEAYESGSAPAFELYGLGFEHKHVPELQAYTRPDPAADLHSLGRKFPAGHAGQCPAPSRPLPGNLSARSRGRRLSALRGRARERRADGAGCRQAPTARAGGAQRHRSSSSSGCSPTTITAMRYWSRASTTSARVPRARRFRTRADAGSALALVTPLGSYCSASL